MEYSVTIMLNPMSW